MGGSWLLDSTPPGMVFVEKVSIRYKNANLLKKMFKFTCSHCAHELKILLFMVELSYNICKIVYCYQRRQTHIILQYRLIKSSRSNKPWGWRLLQCKFTKKHNLVNKEEEETQRVAVQAERDIKEESHHRPAPF